MVSKDIAEKKKNSQIVRILYRYRKKSCGYKWLKTFLLNLSNVLPAVFYQSFGVSFMRDICAAFINWDFTYFLQSEALRFGNISKLFLWPFFLLGFSQKNSQNQKATVFKLKYYTYSLKSRKIIICCSKRYRLYTLTDDKRIHFCGQTGQFTVRQADGVHHVQCKAVLRIPSHFRSIRIQPKILIWIWIQTFSLPCIYGMLRRRKKNVYCRMLKKW